ncbi:MAG: condensation domain-containing protein [Chthoniobacterales bacterium]
MINPLFFAKHVNPSLRPLGSFEHFFWLLDQNRPVHFALAAEVQGTTEIQLWRDALKLVQRRHPLLSVRIETNGSGRPHFRQEVETTIPLRVRQENNATRDWADEMELELSIPFDPQGAPLVRAVLLHEADQAAFILVAHHSIADGRSIAFVIRDLLQALSGRTLDSLPLLPPHEEILGLTGNGAIRPDRLIADTHSPVAPAARLATYISKEDLRPRIKSLRLTPGLTRKLRERARQEGTTVHGAISAAVALAAWLENPNFKHAPIRICSPIDTRKLLGLGEDCAALVDAGIVNIRPHMPVDFWDLARESTVSLSRAQTLKGVVASRSALCQALADGVDVPAAAAICAQAFAHDIMLTNLGNLPFGSDFGQLRLDAIWGPAVSARFAGAPTIGVATTNGSLRLLETSFSASDELLETTEEILKTASVGPKRSLSQCSSPTQPTVKVLPVRRSY